MSLAFQSGFSLHWIPRKSGYPGLMVKSIDPFCKFFSTYHTFYSVATNSLPSSGSFPGATVQDVFHYPLCSLLQKTFKGQDCVYLESGGCYSIKQLHGTVYAESKWLLFDMRGAEKS